MIVPVIPSRGVIFAETIRSLQRNEVDINKLIVVSGLPIPDGHNKAVREALKSAPSHILMVEDDMVIPDRAVYEMVKLDKAVVAVDYPVANGWSTIARKNGEITHTGLGCTLVNASVFKNMEDPWFTTDKSIDYKTGEVKDAPYKYGGHDIWFGRKVREAGYEIHQLEGFEAGHLRCQELTRSENNDGKYNIYELPKVTQKEE